MKINELLIHKFTEDAPEYIIITGKKTMYFVENDDTDETKEQLQEIVNKEGWKINDDIDLYLFGREINELYPQVITFKWEADSDTVTYYIPGLNHNIDIRISKHFIDALKKLKNELKIKWIEVTESVLHDSGDESEYEETYSLSELITNFEKDLKYKKLPDVVYHGTTTKFLNKILNTGLVSYQEANIRKSNFKDIEHSRLFLTSNPLDSWFYANNAARNNGGFPIILLIDTKSIDINKIGYDYDFYIDYIGGGADEEFDEIGTLRKYAKHIEDEDYALKHLRDKYIGASYRKFSYDGRIMPKWIANIFYNSSSSDAEFENIVEPDEYKDFLDLVDWTEDVYGYDTDEYHLNMDAYKEYQENEDEKEDDNMENEMYKINESPDHIYKYDEESGQNVYYRYSRDDAYAFGYYQGKIYVTEGQNCHAHLCKVITNKLSGLENDDNKWYVYRDKVDDTLYNKGRVWLNAKLVSFYSNHYPKKNDLQRIVFELEEALSEYLNKDIKIWNNGFLIEIEPNVHPDFEKYVDYRIQYEGVRLIPLEMYNYGKSDEHNKKQKEKPWWYRQLLYGEKLNIDMDEMIKFSESVSPNQLEVYFDNVQDIMKQKLVKDPFNIPPDEVEKYLDDAITNTVINQLKIKEFVVTEHERGSSEEQVADMILSQQKEGLGKNDIFKKKNVNDKNGVYTDQDVPNPLLGEMIKFEDFINEENKKDMNGKKCTKCKKGKYKETGQLDDLKGVLHCDKCDHEINRYIYETC